MAEFTKVAGNEICEIKVYALSTCLWCKRAKSFFENKNIAYSFLFVDLLPSGEQEEIEVMLGEHTGIISYPIIFAEGHDVIVGYNEKKLTNLIEAHKDE